MVRRKLPSAERNLPGLNFIIYLPIRYDISSKVNQSDSFREDFTYESGQKNLTASDAFRKILFATNKIKDEKELLKKYPEIDRKLKEIKNILNNKMGILNSEVSKFFVEKAKEKYPKLKEKW